MNLRFANATSFSLLLACASGCAAANDSGLSQQGDELEPRNGATDVIAGGAGGGTASGGTAGGGTTSTTGGTGGDFVTAVGGANAGNSGGGTPAVTAGGEGNVPDNVDYLEGNFSFFITSLEAMRELSGSEEGFGGDLGGLAGADSICQRTAEREKAHNKTWRAFLSATQGAPGGGPVHAIDRIGEGPWYNRNGLLLAENKAGLLQERPAGDANLKDALTNERGEPLGLDGVDDHDILTASDAQGRLFADDPAKTCQDWTSTETDTTSASTGTTTGTTGSGFPFPGGGGPGGGGMGEHYGPMAGHAWPAFSGTHWIASHPVNGCAAGVNLVQDGPGSGLGVGNGGGWGALYCFALSP